MAIYSQLGRDRVYGPLGSGTSLAPSSGDRIGLNMQPEMPGGYRMSEGVALNMQPEMPGGVTGAPGETALNMQPEMPGGYRPSLFDSGATAEYSGGGGAGPTGEDRASDFSGGGMPSDYWTPEQKAGPSPSEDDKIVPAKKAEAEKENPVARMWAEAQTGGPQAATRSYVELLSKAKNQDEANSIKDGYLKLQEVMRGKRRGVSRIIKGGRAPQSWVTERDLGPSDETRMQLENQEQVIGADRIALAELEQQRANHFAGLEQLRAVGVQKELAAQEAEVKKTDAMFQEMMRQHAEYIDQTQNMQVDPKRWWSSKSTGEKIAAGIFVVITAGKGLDVLMKARDDDIAAQMSALQHAKDVTELRQSQIGQLWEMYKDGNLVKAALREGKTAAIGAKIEAMRKQVPEGELQQRLKLMSEEVEGERLRARAEFEKALMGKQRMTEAMIPDRIVTAGGGVPTNDKALAELTAMAFGPGGTPRTETEKRDIRGRTVVTPEGKTLYAMRETDAKDAQAGVTYGYAIMNKLEMLKQLREQVAWNAAPGERKKIFDKMELISNSILSDMRKVDNTGAAMSEQEAKAIEPFTGKKAHDWESMARSEVRLMTQLESASDVVRAKYEGHLNLLSTDPDTSVPYRPREEQPVK